jgi:hypothetical protein
MSLWEMPLYPEALALWDTLFSGNGSQLAIRQLQAAIYARQTETC